MKKLHILALTMLVSASVANASTMKEKIATAKQNYIAANPEKAQAMSDKIAAKKAALVAANPEKAAAFEKMSQSEKRAALAEKYPSQAAAVSNFQGMSKQEKMQALYQNRVANNTKAASRNESIQSRMTSRPTTAPSGDNLGSGMEEAGEYGSGDYSGEESGEYGSGMYAPDVE